MRARRTATVAALALAALLAVAGGADAYTVYLKDGARILAKEKYEIVGDKAYIVLPSGTRSVIDADEIDVQRTEAANRSDYGTAMVLEGGEVKEMTEAPPPPRRKTLADLITDREREPREQPSASRRIAAGTAGELPRTEAGYADLRAVPRRPFSDLDLGGELKQLFAGQGIDQLEIYQGTAGDRLLLIVTTNSEAAVFRTLAVTASGLLYLRQRHPGRIGAFELVMMTPTRERAGQFVITPEMAQDLVGREVDVQTFYLAHLQF